MLPGVLAAGEGSKGGRQATKFSFLKQTVCNWEGGGCVRSQVEQKVAQSSWLSGLMKAAEAVPFREDSGQGGRV